MYGIIYTQAPLAGLCDCLVHSASGVDLAGIRDHIAIQAITTARRETA